MARPRKPRNSSVAAQWAAVGVAAPQVVAHRLGRMATAGPVLSARDRKEFTGMVMEKQVVFAQSWTAMWFEACMAQQQLALSFMTGTSSLPRQAAQVQAAVTRIAAKGLAPVHRQVVGNARRLGR